MLPFSKEYRQIKDSSSRKYVMSSIRRNRMMDATGEGFGNNEQNSLTKNIAQFAHNLLNKTSQSQILGKFTQEMENRDHYALIQTPLLAPQKAIRQKQIKIWLGYVCRRVFSTSFQYFSSKVFDTQTTKIFCSESFIGNIIALSKKNILDQTDYYLINNHLKQQLLPYFLLRYPQSNNKEVNQKLNKAISHTDALDTNQNDMFMKSGIKFQYRKDGEYFDLIMLFINHVLSLPDLKIKVQKNGKAKNQTLFDQFNVQMQNLFQSVYNRQWTETDLYTYYENSDEDVQTLRKKVEILQNKTIHKNLNNYHVQKLNIDDKQYQNDVKSYTHYAINRKISENTQRYSEQDIRYGNIKVQSSQVLRIIIKWCGELEQKFERDYYIDRDEPFVMLKGGEVEMTSDNRVMLNQILKKEWKQIEMFLNDIHMHIQQSQAERSFNNLMFYSKNTLPEFQESLIKFAAKNTDDVIHFAIAYLNRLIHGLMNASNKIYSGNLQQWAQWPYPPQLITFTISDLIRCKCFSRQNEVVRMYRQLEIQSEINPKKLRIVKIKNRLNKGTKDILINFLFHEKILCEIQLAIKVSVTDFILYSDKFNHYIYELKRAIFGPVNQMCSIWSNNDERSSLLKDEKIFVPLQKIHKCAIEYKKISQNLKEQPNQQSFGNQKFPFTCSVCQIHYSQSVLIFNHKKCLKCKKYWICAVCRMKLVPQDKLMKQLKLPQNYVGDRVHNKSQLSEYIIIFPIQSAKIIGQVYRIFQIQSELYFVSKEAKNKIKVKKFDEKKKKNVMKNVIIFTLKQKDDNLDDITIQDVMDFLVLQQISMTYHKKYEALRIANRNITKQVLLKIKDPRGQLCVKNFSFPNNCINQLRQIGEYFKNVRFLNLNNNGLESMKGIGGMKSLTDVYLGQNNFKQIIQLQNLDQLKYIQLGDNKESPKFQCSLSGLKKLTALTLVTSQLKQFPNSVIQAQNLQLLWLFHNQITQIPKSISRLKHLKHLHLYNNQLRQIPKQLYTLQNLRQINVSRNKIEQIDEDIGNLKRLSKFAIDQNSLKPAGFPCKQVQKLKDLTIFTLDKYMQEQIADKIQPRHLHKFVFI